MPFCVVGVDRDAQIHCVDKIRSLPMLMQVVITVTGNSLEALINHKCSAFASCCFILLLD
jgi:hypothetical protein